MDMHECRDMCVDDKCRGFQAVIDERVLEEIGRCKYGRYMDKCDITTSRLLCS